MGLLRLPANHYVIGQDVLSAAGSWRVPDRITRESNIFFAAEPPGPDQAWKDLTIPRKSGASFWTDAYLAAFSSISGYTLVTFDRAFARYRNVPVTVPGADS